MNESQLASLRKKHGLTRKQAKAVAIMADPTKSANLTLGQMAMEAGYTGSAVKTPGREVFNRPKVKRALADVAQYLDTAIFKIGESLAKHNYEKEEATKRAYILDKVVKNRQLVTGGSTENTEIKVSWGE